MTDRSIDRLASLVTKRDRSFFQDDLDAHREYLGGRIGGRRILVIGGAGSIGSSTVRILAEYNPAALYVVDQNENDLVELVRQLRNESDRISYIDFRTLPLDFGSPLMRRFLLDSPPFDFVLNFAAIKHVRSEKDAFSLLRMIDVNLVKTGRLLEWLSEKQGEFRYFCVSTDKAANPVNLMGASKHLMEQLIFSREMLPGTRRTVTSARFANVAFSKGSLLESFLIRLSKNQPLAAPRDTRRYFISPQESGQICVLAAFCAPDGHLLIPTLDPGVDLVDLESVAVAVLAAYGLKPRIYEDESAARKGVSSCLEKGCYPLLLTPLDTSGEKPYEEFVGEGEEPVDMGMKALMAVKYARRPSGPLFLFIDYIDGLMSNPDTSVEKTDIVERIQELLPHFRHMETGKSLDDRM